MVLRVLEPCEVGIPLPHWMAEQDCIICAVNNHGICGSNNDVVENWSRFFEVYSFRVVRLEQDRVSDIEGEATFLLTEFLVELDHVLAGSVMSFETQALDITCTGTVTACAVTFGCARGCASAGSAKGGTSCGCRARCDDGTQSWYMPFHCEGDSRNHLYYSLNGGLLTGQIALPLAQSTTPQAATCPLVVENGNELYVAANQEPAELFRVPLDAHGVPQEDEVVRLGVLGDTGIATALGLSGDDVHILIEDAAESRFYTESTQGDTCSIVDGARQTFDVGVNQMAICGNRIVFGGMGPTLSISEDGGRTSTNLVDIPGVAATDIVSDIELVDGRIWVALEDGRIFHTLNEGLIWHEVSLGLGEVNDLAFLNDRVGWIAHGGIAGATQPGALFSTWLGGTTDDLWTRRSPRIGSWPTDFVAERLALPCCASEPLASNTVLAVGDVNGALTVVMGRTSISGV